MPQDANLYAPSGPVVVHCVPEDGDAGFVLCDSCRGRIAAQGRRQNHRAFGRRLNKRLRQGTRCFVCKGAMDHLDTILGIIHDTVSAYDYDTFSLGAILKPSVLDRDDYVRSCLRAQGSDPIKSVMAGDLAKMLACRTGRTHDRNNPDIAVLIDTRHNICEVRSRHVMVQARYIKNVRGLPQRNDVGDTAESSVQGILEKILQQHIGGTGVRFTWVGGEDQDSLVQGQGRRVYARIQNPIRRQGPLPKTVLSGGVSFTDIGIVKRLPDRLPSFHSIIRVRIKPSEQPDTGSLRRLHDLAGPVLIRDGSSKPSTRHIHDIKYRSMTDGSILVTMDAEGGLPVKRFVSGQGVNPSVSEALGMPCVCAQFDFVQIYDNS